MIDEMDEGGGSRRERERWSRSLEFAFCVFWAALQSLPRFAPFLSHRTILTTSAATPPRQLSLRRDDLFPRRLNLAEISQFRPVRAVFALVTSPIARPPIGASWSPKSSSLLSLVRSVPPRSPAPLSLGIESVVAVILVLCYIHARHSVHSTFPQPNSLRPLRPPSIAPPPSKQLFDVQSPYHHRLRRSSPTPRLSSIRRWLLLRTLDESDHAGWTT